METDDKEFEEFNCDPLNTDSADKYKRYPIQPLLIRDLLNVEVLESNIFALFNQSLQFKRCILFGRIVSIMSRTPSFTRYMLDDGTGCIDLAVGNTDKELKNIERLRREIHLNEEEDCIKESLLRILSTTSKFLDITNLLPGTRVTILARPSMFGGKLHVVSNSMYVDDLISRDMEISFKNMLINCYTTRAKAAEATLLTSNKSNN